MLPPEAITQPVAFARLLWEHGASLKKAKDSLEQLLQGLPAVIELNTDALDQLLAELQKLGIPHGVLEVPDVDVKRIREESQLSQSDFARWFGLEVDTVRNWEQRRYPPEGAARVLLRVIEHDPQAVIRSLVRRDFMAKWLSRYEMAWDQFETGWPKPKLPAPEGYVWVLRPKQTDHQSD